MATVLDHTKLLAGQLLKDAASSSEKMPAKMRPERDLEVRTESFMSRSPMTSKYTQMGDSISPSLEWQGAPADAISLAIICEDPDAPMPEPCVHWIAYNIPPRLSELPEGLPAGDLPQGGKHGKNYLGKTEYAGPKPPVGHGAHHYHFQVFALDRELNFFGPPDRNAMVDAMRGHVLAQGEVVGTYERSAE
jgi:Raf kinase inhibitor-like YbhB/YbcL family protein